MPSVDDLIAEVKGARPSRVDEDTAALKSRFAGPSESLSDAASSDASGLMSMLSSLDVTNPRNLPNVAYHGIPMALQMAATLYGGPSAGRAAQMARGGAGALAGYLAQEGMAPLAGRESNLSPGMAFLNLLLGAGSEATTQLAGAAGRRVTGKAGLLAEGEAAAKEAEAKALKGQDAFDTERTGALMDQQARLADVGQAAEAKALQGQQAYDEARTGAMMDQQAKLADTEKLAEQKALAEREAAEAKVRTRQEMFDQQRLKHTEEALTSVRDEELERQVRETLGGPSPLENPTIETLSTRAAPIRESAERNVRGIFRGISQKFEDRLTPYYDLPVAGNFSEAVDAERALLDAGKDKVGKTLGGVMDDLASLDAGSSLKVGALPAPLRKEYERLKRTGTMSPEALDRHIGMLAKGFQGPGSESAVAAFAPPDVRRMDDIRKKLTGIVIGDGSAVEKRVANRLIRSVDGSLETVLPENVRADWANLRREWRESNAVFSPRFRSILFKADTPAAVADALYGAASGKQAHRALTVIRETPADELPMLRSAFAERLNQGDAVANVEKLDPRVFRQLFQGTGFDTPQAWTDAMRTNMAQRLRLEQVMADPTLSARFNDRYRQGLRSFGSQRAQLALDRAHEQLRNVKDPGRVIMEALGAELSPEQAADVALRGKSRPDVSVARSEALARELTPEQAADEAMRGKTRPDVGAASQEARVQGEMEGMRRPIIGKGMQTYLEHHTALRTTMALVTLGTMAHEFSNHPVMASLPLAYLGGSKAAAALLSNPKVAKIWHNALTSKNYEQAGFWLGRLAAASLTEGARSAD